MNKKDPSAAVSDPTEPIVLWIENTTPVEIRPIIEKAALSWNAAFEKAGFSNAIQVKTQPDDATWSADDIRYNVLRWTSSPYPIFGGYGPRFANPRTGQILGADVMLEFSFLTNRINSNNIFGATAGAAAYTAMKHTEHPDHENHDAHTEADGHTDLDSFMANLRNHQQFCNLANHLQLSNQLGKTFATVHNLGAEAKKRLLEESIYYLVLHEIGHTLGLSHNMKASYSRPYDEVHDSAAQEDGLVASVMDYPAINYAPAGQTQAGYYTTKPGAYDTWAIQFGYAPEMDDPDVRRTHLARSTDPLLVFGNDADDMRAAGLGIDPRVNIHDFSDDPIQYAQDRLILDKDVMSQLEEKIVKTGQGYQELRNSFGILLQDMLWQGRTISRYIGGIYVDRAIAGQNGATAPYRPVELARQKQAMRILRDHIFAPDAFQFDPALLRTIAVQRRGFALFGQTEDPKMHGVVISIQADILSQLLHPVTMMRLTDSGLYGNEYSVAAMVTDLTDAVFKDDSRGEVNSYRQELQILYTYQMINILHAPGSYDFIARSAALSSLRSIKKSMTRWRGDISTRAHRDHIMYLIDKALDTHED